MQAFEEQPQKRYTYADYLTWEGEERYELIDGVAYMMAPAPTTEHQSISLAVVLQLGNFLAGKPCKMFYAPVDVRLNADRGDNTVVQPDILVVCDQSKIDSKGIKGAPDLVMEIVSPSSSSYDSIFKFQKYMKAGVREYWIIDPERKVVNQFVLQDGGYFARGYEANDVIPVEVLPGCEIDLGKVFPSLPQVAEDQA